MYNFRKIFALLFFALQMGVMEYALFHIFGWVILLVASTIGSILWLIIVCSVGNGNYQGTSKW